MPGRGLRRLIRRSKTDQRGAGQEVAIWADPGDSGFCPAAALEARLGFRREGPDITGGASDAALPLLVGMSKAGRAGQGGGAGRRDRGVGALLRAFTAGGSGA
ncbi:hypothetical protein ACFQX4_26375 [Roseomonas sp. GCM10028921]